MFYDFSFLRLWLALALLLGAVVGWMTCKRDAEPSRFAGWIRWASIAWIVGLTVAMLNLLPGRIGFWLETALFFLAFYLVGCLVGGWLKSALATEPVDIAVALAKPAPPMPVRPFASAPPSVPVRRATRDPIAPPPPAQAPVATPGPVALPDPEPAAAVMGEHDHVGVRPPGFAAPRQRGADDLKRIRGIGPQNEGRLHALGVWHFAQIAEWTNDNVLWIGSYLAFPGRIDREEWLAQAKALAMGRETTFSELVERGRIASKREDGTHGEHNIADLSKSPSHK